MKYFYTLIIVALFSVNNLYAVHGLPLVNYNYTVGATGITISADQDQNTCGSGPYWMQVELATSASSLTGNPPVAMQTILASWPCTGGGVFYNQGLWFNSTHNIPDLCNDNCTAESYNNVFIPFTSLVCGNVYYFQAREWVSGSNSPGPWTAVNSFTVPGNSALPLSFSLTANSYTICSLDSTLLSTTNIVNGPITSYTWSNGLGNSSTVYVKPLTNSTYSLSAENSGACIYSNTVSINVIPYVNPYFIPINSIICTGNNIIFSAIGSTIATTHSWDINPPSGYTINNTTTTPTPDVTFNSNGNYIVTHSTTVSSCTYTASTTVMVNTCTGFLELENDNFSIYPNPSINGVFYINSKNKEAFDIEVIDLLGKNILTIKNFEEEYFKLKNTSNGIYFLKIINSEKQQIYSKKIIVN